MEGLLRIESLRDREGMVGDLVRFDTHCTNVRASTLSFRFLTRPKCSGAPVLHSRYACIRTLRP